jgi:signal transduction histidine kinase
MTGVRKSPFRLATVCIVLIIAAVAVVGSIATQRAAHSEEKKLLNERASEIGLILSDAFTGLQSEVATTAAETALNGANGKAFTAAATSLIPPQPGASTSLARVTGTSGPVRFVAMNGALTLATSAPRDVLIRRALTVHPAALTSAVYGQGSGHVLGLAYPVGTGSLVIYREIPLNPAANGSRRAGDQPFRELSVALYAGRTQDPGSLVLTTGGTVPLHGSVAVASTQFGADTWLVAIKARSPLIGSFAVNAYWLVLGVGLVVALAIGALVESLGRRRDYALALVDERTEELSDSVVKLEEAQDQLLRSARLAAIGELASAVGHELRNPLGVITNAHYLLRSQLEQQDANGLVRHLATAEREVGTATLIVSDLLDFARAREPLTAPVDVPELIDEINGVVPPPPGISISRDDAPDAPPALADRDQLRQVLLNLLTNAYEAMPEGGTVSFSVRETGGRLEIRVVDSGIGMDEETAARVFEPFFTRKARGIGLGLAVTKRIVDSHGGTISVVTSPGGGSTFTVDLPVAVREPAR